MTASGPDSDARQGGPLEARSRPAPYARLALASASADPDTVS